MELDVSHPSPLAHRSETASLRTGEAMTGGLGMTMTSITMTTPDRVGTG